MEGLFLTLLLSFWTLNLDLRTLAFDLRLRLWTSDMDLGLTKTLSLGALEL